MLPKRRLKRPLRFGDQQVAKTVYLPRLYLIQLSQLLWTLLQIYFNKIVTKNFQCLTLATCLILTARIIPFSVILWELYIRRLPAEQKPFYLLALQICVVFVMKYFECIVHQLILPTV